MIIPAGLASIYAPYYWNHYKRPIYKWQMVLYLIFDRAVLLIFCAWLSYASMVLNRKKPSKDKQTAKSQQTQQQVPIDQSNDQASQQQSNLASTVSMINLSSSPKDANVINESAKDDTLLSVASSRLRSGQQQQEGLIKDLVSSSTPNLTEPTGVASATNNDNNNNKRTNGLTANNNKRPITSALNTLCLVLSRLTFQLYLFNMVVLWFDVNHSKYLWYFSYYFIIVKAFAVYTASAIFATIFFVTLESPCLTLYILWVKYRAQKRAEREELSREVNQDLYEANKKMQSPQLFEANSMPAATAPSIRVESQLVTGGVVGDHPEQIKQARQGLFSGIYHVNSSSSIHSMAVTPIMKHASRDKPRV